MSAGACWAVRLGVVPGVAAISKHRSARPVWLGRRHRPGLRHLGRRLFRAVSVKGQVRLLLGGLNLLAIGLLGEMQVRHYHEPSRRAPYSVDRVLRSQNEEHSVSE